MYPVMPPFQAYGSKLAGVIARAGAKRQHERTATCEGFDRDAAAVRAYINGLNRQQKEYVTAQRKQTKTT